MNKTEKNSIENKKQSLLGQKSKNPPKPWIPERINL